MADSSEGLMYGPMLIGTCLNCVLYGATVIQTYIYFQTFKSDKPWTKIFVFYLLVCETFNTIFDVGVVFEPLIIRYGTPQALTNAPIMLSTSPLLTVMISLPVQLFIAWRVKVISNSIVLPAIITFLAFAAFAGGVATTIAVIVINFEYSRFPTNDGAVITWLVSSAAADTIITASLVYFLLRKRTGFSTTDDIINRLVRMTIQTGLITAVSASLDVLLFLLVKGHTWNYMFDLALSKLYSNSILSTLNARGGWKATSMARDNVLFPHGTGVDIESMGMNRTQISVITDTQLRRHSSQVPTKTLSESEEDDVRQHGSSALKDATECGETV